MEDKIKKNISLPAAEVYFEHAMRLLQDHGAVLYIGNYRLFITFRDHYIKSGIPISVVYKPEFNDDEWKMVSEKGEIYSTGIVE